MDELDKFLDQFYNKYSPDNIPSGDRRLRLKEKLSNDFDGYVTQMYAKYAPDNIPDNTRLNKLKSKYLVSSVANNQDTTLVQLDDTNIENQPIPTEAALTLTADDIDIPAPKITPDKGFFEKVGSVISEAADVIKEDITKTLPKNLAAALAFNVQSEVGEVDIDQWTKNIQKLQSDPQKLEEAKTQTTGKLNEILSITDPQKLKSALVEYDSNNSMAGEIINTSEQLFGKTIETENILSIADVTDGETAAKFFVNNLVKGGRQILTGALTLGTSIIPEALGDVYLETIDQQAAARGISREAAAKDPTVLKTTAAVTSVVSLVEKLGLDKILKGNSNAFTGFLKGFATESVTETLQEAAQGLGIKLGTGQDTMEYLTSDEFMLRLADSFLAGGISGGASKSVGSVIKSTPQQTSEQLGKEIAKEIINEPIVQPNDSVVEEKIVSDSEVQATIDDVATPEDLEVVKEIDNEVDNIITELNVIIKEESKNITKDSKETTNGNTIAKETRSITNQNNKKLTQEKPTKKEITSVKRTNKKPTNKKIRVDESIIDLETGEVKTATGPKINDKSKSKVDNGDLKVTEKLEAKKAFLDKQLFNIKNDPRPANKLKRAENFINRQKDDPNFQDKIFEANKIINETKAQVALKKEKRELKLSKPKTLKLTQEEKAIESEKRKKAFEDKKLKVAKENKAIELEAEIVKLRRQGKDDAKAIENYQDFRESEFKSGKLDPIKLEAKLAREIVQTTAIKQSTKEFKSRAKRLIPKDQFEDNSLNSTKKSEPTEDELKSIEKELERGLLDSLNQDFDDDFTTSYNISPEYASARGGLDYTNIKEVSKQEYTSKVKESPQSNVSGLLSEMIDKVDTLREKSGLPKVKFYFSDGPKENSGAHITDGVNTAIIINRNALNVSSTQVHEMIHEYFSVIAQIGYFNGMNNEFTKAVKSVYNEALTRGNEILSSINEKISNGARLNWEESKFKRAVEFVTDSSIENLVNLKQFYGFTSDTEFVAEAFSNLDFIYLLDTIPSSKVTSGQPSLLTRLYESMVEFLKSIMPNTYPEYKSQLNTLVDVMSDFENQYLNSDYLLKKVKGTAFSIQQSKSNFKNDIRSNVVDKIVDSIELNDSISSKAQVILYTENVNKKLSENNKLSSKEIKSVWLRFNNRRKTFANINKLKKDIRLKLNDQNDLSELKSKMINDILELDPSKLKPVDRNIIKNGLGDVLKNGIYDASTEKVVQKLKSKIIVDDLNKNKSFNFRDISKRFSNMYKTLNPAQFVTFISKHNKEIANDLFDKFYSGIMRANAVSQLELETLVSKGDNSLFNITSKNKLTSEDSIKAYMFSTLFTSDEILEVGSDEYENNIQKNLTKLEEGIKTKLKAKELKLYDKQSKAQINRELELFQELKNEVNTKDRDSILTSGQNKLLDRFKEIVASFEEDAIINTEVVHGKKFIKLQNYIPTYALGSIGTKELGNTSDDLVKLLESNDQTESLSTPQSAFTRRRFNKVNDVYYDNDLLSVASKYISSISFDNNVSREVRTLSRVLNNKKLADYIGVRNSRVLKESIKMNIQSAIRKGGEYSNWVKNLENFKNKLVVGRMGTIGQFAVQLLATIPSTAIYAPSGMQKALKTMYKFESNDPSVQKLEDFMVKNGLGIQVRDVLFEKFENIDDFAKGGIRRGLKKGIAKAEASTTAVLRWSDKQAAKLTWLSAFFEEGGDIDNPTKEAIVAAERKTMLLQNVSDVTFAPALFKPTTDAGRLLISQMMSFKSFALNQFLNTLYSIRDFNTSPEARKILVANMSNVLMYQAATSLLVKPFYTAIAEMISGEEEEEEEDIMESILVRSMYDMAFGGLPAPLEQFIKLIISKITDNVLDEDNAFKSVNVYAPRQVEDIFAEGPYGDLATTLFNSSQVITESLKDDPKWSDEKMSLITSRLLADAIMYSNMIPFRGDASKISRNIIRISNQDEEKKNSNNKLKLNTPKKRSSIKLAPPKLKRPIRKIKKLK